MTRRRVPKEVRERQMLDAAVATFGRLGYRAASMDGIAERAGVSKPLLYLYLNSKEELFTACIRREAAALAAAVTGAVDAEESPERQLWSGLLGFFTHTADHPDGWAVLYRQARTTGEPFAAEVDVLREGLVEYVAGLFAAAARDAGCDAALVVGEVTALAHALVGAAESLADWAGGAPPASGDRPEPKDTAATLMDFAWPGLEALLARARTPGTA
ncbi:TetR/AcrR family transcriptional regulator [Actinacidiphila glaucinigra]|uniref:TetR/AcrR family transcriptional regulator n=1 Tax=Actinacidiphila glaucinigra TaxID=235986 RepID=UPI003F4BDB9B